MSRLKFALALMLPLSAYAEPICSGLEAPDLLPGSTVTAPPEATLCSYFDAPAVLIVNTASQCGYTPQFKELEALYQRYKDQGLQVLGFPSDNFGGQEYAQAERTADVCFRNYGVTFPMFEKTVVKGPEADALFTRLAAASAPPRWNFHKFLVTSEGVTDFPSAVAPLDPKITSEIERALKPAATP